MQLLGMTREEFAKRIGTKEKTLDRWLLPDYSKDSRAMPDIAWKFVDEIIERATNGS